MEYWKNFNIFATIKIPKNSKNIKVKRKLIKAKATEADYKINIQKLIAFLHANNKTEENE